MLPYLSNTNKSNKTIFINPNFRGKLPTPETDVSLQSPSVIPKNAHINPLFLEAHKSRHTIHMNPAFLQKFQEHQQLQPQEHDNPTRIGSTLRKEAGRPSIVNSAAAAPNESFFPRQEFISTAKLLQQQEKDAIKRKSLPENPNNLLTHQFIEIATNSSGAKTVTTETRKIICKSKNRLIREPLVKQPLKLSKSIPLPPLLVLSKCKLIRKASTEPAAFSKPQKECCDNSNAKITKYKLDNRVIRRKALLPPTPRIKRTSYVGRYALRRTSMSQSSTTLAKKSIAINKNTNKKLQVLNINGLLYKSTQNSLKLKNIDKVRPCNNPMLKSSKAISCGKNTSSNNELKPIQGLTIFVRGTKYVMDANKFKLTRVTNSEHAATNIMANKKCSQQAPACQRIDIGGYTYISVNSAKNVLIRTTNHLSRAYVHNAKQKSLQMLTKRLVKTNIPCPIFQRIGKCAAFERGKCSKVHNKLQVAICSKFLRGECLNTNCLLSHNISLSKMPVCKFFLQGVCVRNDCPYLHKKLSNKAELCTEFLRGFCQLADKCNKRHEFLCPEIERNNVCSTKNCIYCNAKRRKESKIERKSEILQSKEINYSNLKLPLASSSAVEATENPSSNRYFIEPCDKNIKHTNENSTLFTNEGNGNNIETSMESCEENVEHSRKTRPKLGILPSYIPL